MNSKLIKLLVSACIGLCLIIAAEWLYARYMRHRLLTSISAEKPYDYKVDELPKIQLMQQPEENYTDLVARPLFIKGRKPVDEPLSRAQQASTQSERFNWELTGVYGTKENLSGLFSRSEGTTAKDKHRKITLGDELDGWKLTEINRDRAILKQGDKEKELLLRKPKLKTLPQRIKRAIPAAPIPAPAAIRQPAADTTKDTPEGNDND